MRFHSKWIRGRFGGKKNNTNPKEYPGLIGARWRRKNYLPRTKYRYRRVCGQFFSVIHGGDCAVLSIYRIGKQRAFAGWQLKSRGLRARAPGAGTPTTNASAVCGDFEKRVLRVIIPYTDVLSFSTPRIEHKYESDGEYKKKIYKKTNRHTSHHGWAGRVL